MDYTTSDAYATHVATGNRMHQDTSPVTTAVTAKDLNQVIWNLMKLLEGAGISAASFDPANVNTYNRVLLAVQGLAGVSVAGTIKFGSYSSDITSGGTPATVTFPVAFPTACDAVVAVPRNTAPDGSADAWPTLRSRSAANFVMGADWAGSGGSDVVHGFDWIAVGH